jgi:hypothetical protein
LDRIIRGRLWIGIIGFALIGIVAMQVAVLQLHTDVARGLETKSTLLREISSAQVSGSTLGSGSQIETEAAQKGMVLQAGAPAGFLRASRVDLGAAAAVLAGTSSQSATASSIGLSASPTAGAANEAGSAASTELAGSAVSAQPSTSSSVAAAEPAAGGPATSQGTPATTGSQVVAGATTTAASESSNGAVGATTGDQGGATQAPGAAEAVGAQEGTKG